MPVNRFGAPWSYKNYADEVFHSALAAETLLAGDSRTHSDPNRHDGCGGKMQGKRFMVSATGNDPREAFDNPGGSLMHGTEIPQGLASGWTHLAAFCA